MAAALYDMFIEKGVDFSTGFNLLLGDGSYADFDSLDTCVKASIVEFQELPPITGFSITGASSGVVLSLSEDGSRILPFGECYYDVVVSVSGVSEKIRYGTITTQETATNSPFCS